VDLSKMVEFPFEDNFIFLAYCSHVLEHLTDEVVCNVISQVYRILRPGGVFRIIVPDLYTAYCAYFLNDFRYYDHRSQCRQKNKSIVYVTSSGHLKGRSIGESFVQRIASALGHISEFDSLPLDLFLQKSIHSSSPEQIAISLLNTANFENKLPHQHINYFTFDKFLSLLSDVGFRLVLRSSYGQSLIPLMRNKVYFDQTRPNESLWVEAIK
ncbi:MAG: methyltransferase domain-containing protein, partial [Proteobacteria bacterium]|nr:methyltransferase domain-containing protein [Pseudomonadota bacterium]